MIPIKGFDNYFICENGDVYSNKTGSLRKLKSFTTRNGYHYVDMRKNGQTHRRAVHRLVCYHFCEGYFEGAEVNHIDANTHNNHYSNLEWCTSQYNKHCGYISSGIDATRNFYYYQIEFPDKKLSPKLKGYEKVKQYVIENNLKLSVASLQKYGASQGYKLIKTH